MRPHWPGVRALEHVLPWFVGASVVVHGRCLVCVDVAPLMQGWRMLNPVGRADPSFLVYVPCARAPVGCVGFSAGCGWSLTMLHCLTVPFRRIFYFMHVRTCLVRRTPCARLAPACLARSRKCVLATCVGPYLSRFLIEKNRVSDCKEKECCKEIWLELF